RDHGDRGTLRRHAREAGWHGLDGRASRHRVTGAQADVSRRSRRNPRARRAGRARPVASDRVGTIVNRINAPDGTSLVYDAYERAQPRVAVLSLHDWHPRRVESAEPSADIGAALRDAGYAAYFLD